jgi:hypothetical protein
MIGRLKSLLGSRWPLFVLRVALAVVCFAIAVVLMFIPGPAILFWLAGFVMLGFSVGQILMSVQKTQDFLYRHIPILQRLPRMRKGHVRMILRNRWVQWIDRLSSSRERRRARRVARRAQRSLRRAHRRGVAIPAADQTGPNHHDS